MGEIPYPNREYEKAHEQHTHSPTGEQDDWWGAVGASKERFIKAHENGEHEDDERRNCPLCDTDE